MAPSTSTCRGGHGWRAGSGRADGPLFSERRTHLLRSLDGRALSRGTVSQRRTAGREFRILSRRRRISDCAAPPRTFGRLCAGSAGVAPRQRQSRPMASGDGAAYRAQSSCCSQPAIFRPRLWWHDPGGTSACGVASRCGMARGRVAARQVAEGLRGISQQRGRSSISSRTTQNICVKTNRRFTSFRLQTSFDTYWKLYFLLTGGEAK